MARVLYGIGSFCARHRLLVLLAWVVIIVGVGLTVARVGALTSNDLSLPGTDSQRATDLLAERFPPQQNGANPIVFHVEQGTLDAGARKQAIATAAKKLAAIDFVHSAPSPFSTAGAAQLATDRTTAFIPVLLKIGNADLSVADSQRVLDTARAATAGQGIEVAAGGAIGGQLSTPDTESSELVGILVAMVILALTFGSLIAMGLPIISAVVGLMVGLMVVGLLGHLVSIPDIAPTLATMIGLGVGIDYALFLVRRHRQQLDEGMEVNESIAVAVGTSGTAIVFAGTTVVIALLCLAVARIPLVTALGYAAAIAVLTAVIASVTLLPAILALLGHRIRALPIRRRRPPAPGAERGGLWAAWGRLVTARPLLVLAVVLPVLIVLALPVFALNLGQEDIGATPTSTTERQAFDDLSAGFGPGYNGPLLIAVELGAPATVDPTVAAQEQQLTDLQNTLQQEQAEGQRQSAQLQKQAAALTAQQAQLQAQAASLQNQANTLQNQAAELRRRKAAIDAQAAQLRAQIAAIEARFRQILARADGPLARLRAAEAQRQNAERELSQVIARIDRLRQRADAAAHPEARRAILAAIAASRADGDRIRARIAAARQREAQLRSAAAAVRAQAQRQASVPRQLRAEADRLAREAASLARDADSLARQAAALEASKRELEAQGAALQQQAAALTQQQAQLEALQATAKKQQQQALALKNSLTVTLTKAGGDDRGTDPRLVKLQDALGDTAGVNVVSPPQINATGNAATFTAIAATAPADPATADLVARVRDRVVPKATAGTDMTVSVGGSTAANVDLAAEISSRLPLVILVVLGLSVIVLILAFRSLLVPLQAAVVNLICVGSAFGVITAAFQWGWGINLFAIDTPSSTVPIASFVPLMMFAGLFGLSMDYQVFLLSQIAQSREKSDGERAAIADGITHSAPVITAAALIMIGVFGSFVLNGDPTVKQFGVGLSVAVFLAGISVLALVPALLSLLGRAGWYLPAFLQRALPDMDIEGASISERAARATHEPTAHAVADEGRESDPGDGPEPSVPTPARTRPPENAPRPAGDPAPGPSANGGAPSAQSPSPPEPPPPGTPPPPEGGPNGGRPPSAPPRGAAGESSPASRDRRADSGPPSP